MGRFGDYNKVIDNIVIDIDHYLKNDLFNDDKEENYYDYYKLFFSIVNYHEENGFTEEELEKLKKIYPNLELMEIKIYDDNKRCKDDENKERDGEIKTIGSNEIIIEKEEEKDLPLEEEEEEEGEDEDEYNTESYERERKLKDILLEPTIIQPSLIDYDKEQDDLLNAIKSALNMETIDDLCTKITFIKGYLKKKLPENIYSELYDEYFKRNTEFTNNLYKICITHKRKNSGFNLNIKITSLIIKFIFFSLERIGSYCFENNYFEGLTKISNAIDDKSLTEELPGLYGKVDSLLKNYSSDLYLELIFFLIDKIYTNYISIENLKKIN